jgi:hypothetical protein
LTDGGFAIGGTGSGGFPGVAAIGFELGFGGHGQISPQASRELFCAKLFGWKSEADMLIAPDCSYSRRAQANFSK